MQKLSFDQQHFKPAESEHPRQFPADVKFLHKIMELKSKRQEIAKKMEKSKSSEREILKMELENADNQILNYQKSLASYNGAKKTNIAENYANMIGKDFLNSLEEFKRKKQYN